MDDKKKFDQSKYKQEWAKKNKKQFKVDLDIKEYYELCSLLEKKEIKKVDFVRKAFEELKKS